MNDIITLLNLEDSDIQVEDIKTEGKTRIITLFTRPQLRFCPACGFVMHSKGITVRKINHPILQDGFKVILHLKQRRWKCTNTGCGYTENEQFNFIDKHCRNTRATDLMILDAFRDLDNTAADIARRFNTSDTHVLDVFDRFVRMERLPLGIAISVDEVYIDMSLDCRFALVIQNFMTSETIDLLPSRKQEVTEPYFAGIPKEERFAVQYLICDMHNEYINYVQKYFPNAKAAVDSFHVAQWLNRELEQYLRDLQSYFEKRDAEKQAKMPVLNNGKQVKLPMSDEVYLLKNYRFFLLANAENIVRHEESHMDRHFRYFMNTSEYERKFFEISPELRVLRSLRDEYINFNKRNAGKPQKAATELDELINDYKNSNNTIFERFASLLTKYKQPIINSFILVERTATNGDSVVSRLSNGPMEALNRKAKDLKRIARGFRNFDHLRNRFLFSTRTDVVLNGRIQPPDSGEKPLRFSNTVTKDKQKILMNDLETIKVKYPDITKEEMRALKHWISEGNSPFVNPDYIVDENGVYSDFIYASRLLDEAFKEEKN